MSVLRVAAPAAAAAAKLKMHSSYIARTVVMLAVMALSIIVDFIHWVPVLVSVFYPRIVLTAVNLVSFAKSRKKHLAGEDEEPAEDETSEKSAVQDYDDDDEEDGFEKFAKNFYKAPVPGDKKDNQNP